MRQTPTLAKCACEYTYVQTGRFFALLRMTKQDDVGIVPRTT